MGIEKISNDFVPDKKPEKEVKKGLKKEKEKNAEKIKQSLEKIASTRQVESKEILESRLDNVINILKNEPERIRPKDKNGNPGGLIELKEDIPTILIPDLHARREFLLNVLKNKDERGKSNLEKLLNKKIQIVCLGDGIHNEERPERWKEAWAETIKSGRPINTHMEEEMTESLGVMEMIMQLKEASPENFHYLRGNHDDMKETHGGFYKYAKESLQVKNYVLQKFGKDFLDKYAEFEENMPLIAKGNKFIASHTFPDRIINYDEIVNFRGNKENLLKSFCWSRNNVERLGQIRNEMVNKINKTKPTDKKSRATISANYTKITQDYLAPYIKALKGNKNYSYFYGHTPDLYTLKPSCNLHHSGKQFYSNISPKGSFQIINAKVGMEKQRKEDLDNFFERTQKKLEKKKEKPKEEKEEKEKKYEYEWEKQIDSWMEGKIKREMERLKTGNRGIAKQNVREKIRRVLPSAG